MADNAINLDTGTSCFDGVAPGPGNAAKWNSTVTSPNTTLLGSDLTWEGITILDPAGLVTIEGGNTLTLGAAITDINMSAASSDLTLNCPLALGDASVWDVKAGQTLTIGGVVSGDFPLTLRGNGTVRLGTSDVLPNGSGNGNVTFGCIETGNAYVTTILNAASTYLGSTLITCSGSTNTEDFEFSGRLGTTGGKPARLEPISVSPRVASVSSPSPAAMPTLEPPPSAAAPWPSLRPMSLRTYRRLHRKCIARRRSRLQRCHGSLGCQ